MAEVQGIELSADDKANMRTFLRLVYADNPAVVDRWDMNEAVFEIIMEMIEQVLQCSDRMDYVPQPGDLVGGRGGMRYAKKVLKSIAERVEENQGQPSRGIYITCRVAVSRNYRTPLELAGTGL
ncbi:MAG: hypothetical protein JJU06_00340 [Ectothiorhodospiraceae bacterium]|nr:hypothetical protein [Ectothiorhodospiraceae bacterium]MCH8506559.1 hypothetical protein [Ectothiorhodospiraceae bacterium]